MIRLNTPDVPIQTTSPRPPKKPSSKRITDSSNNIVQPLPKSTTATTTTPPPITEIDYTMYYQRAIDLSFYKLMDLKAVAKYNRLSQTGIKSILVDKIVTYFRRCRCIVILQKWARGRLVRRAMSPTLRGQACHNRALCVNESDFYTMEPLTTIPFQRFFSFTDSKQFTYGFDVHSLLTLAQKNTKLINPYNRDEIPESVVHGLFQWYRLIELVFPEHTLDNKEGGGIGPFYPMGSHTDMRRRRRPRRPVLVTNHGGPAPAVENTLIVGTAITMDGPSAAGGVAEAASLPAMPFLSLNRYQTASVSILASNTVPPNVLEIMALLENKVRTVAELRRRSTTRRIQEVFMEIDQLGNYTDAEWMLRLNSHGLLVLYRTLMDIWRFRAQIPYEVKHRICPIEDPFAIIEVRPDQELETMRKHCLNVMENMVLSGLDVEFRKIGAMHVLTALTVVSEAARRSYIWLYETINVGATINGPSELVMLASI